MPRTERHNFPYGLQIFMACVDLLLYASRFGDDVTGVVALAPFLGTRTVVSEITAAGGLARWTATISTTSDEIRSLWAWLQTEGQAPMGDRGSSKSEMVNLRPNASIQWLLAHGRL